MPPMLPTDNERKATRGKRLSFPAATWNKMQDAVKAYTREKYRVGPPGDLTNNITPSTTVLIENGIGEFVDYNWTIVGIGDPSLDPEGDDGLNLMERVAFQAAEPSPDGAFAVLQGPSQWATSSPTGLDEIVPGIVQGVATCWVKFADPEYVTSHHWARPLESDDADRHKCLGSVDGSGPARILWVADEDVGVAPVTGARLATVLLMGPEPATWVKTTQTGDTTTCLLAYNEQSYSGVCVRLPGPGTYHIFGRVTFFAQRQLARVQTTGDFAQLAWHPGGSVHYWMKPLDPAHLGMQEYGILNGDSSLYVDAVMTPWAQDAGGLSKAWRGTGHISFVYVVPEYDGDEDWRLDLGLYATNLLGEFDPVWILRGVDSPARGNTVIHALRVGPPTADAYCEVDEAYYNPPRECECPAGDCGSGSGVGSGGTGPGDEGNPGGGDPESSIDFGETADLAISDATGDCTCLNGETATLTKVSSTQWNGVGEIDSSGCPENPDATDNVGIAWSGDGWRLLGLYDGLDCEFLGQDDTTKTVMIRCTATAGVGQSVCTGTFVVIVVGVP
jgi:hypothetical protein